MIIISIIIISIIIVTGDLRRRGPGRREDHRGGRPVGAIISITIMLLL